MQIRMTHPLHGTHIAYAEAEADANEKNGWAREPATVAPAEPQPAAPREKYRDSWRNRKDR